MRHMARCQRVPHCELLFTKGEDWIHAVPVVLFEHI